MTAPRLVATSWSSAGHVSPMDAPATSPVPIGERIVAIAADGPWGVEILSTAYRALPVGDALKLAAESALTVL
jgi:hypothetical protein